MTEKKENKPADPFEQLKYRGYHRSFLAEGKISLDDYVIYAKTYLCRKTRTLFNDPIWDDYVDEEILVEFYSYVFHYDEEARLNFEREVDMYDEDLHEWFRKMEEQTKKELDEMIANTEDSVTFSPEEM